MPTRVRGCSAPMSGDGRRRVRLREARPLVGLASAPSFLSMCASVICRHSFCLRRPVVSKATGSAEEEEEEEEEEAVRTGGSSQRSDSRREPVALRDVVEDVCIRRRRPAAQGLHELPEPDDRPGLA